MQDLISGLNERIEELEEIDKKMGYGQSPATEICKMIVGLASMVASQHETIEVLQKALTLHQDALDNMVVRLRTLEDAAA